jgi:hypothetical protein
MALPYNELEPYDPVNEPGSAPVYTDPGTYQPIQGPSALYADGPVATFYNKLGRYPGNNKQWWVARAPADDTAKNVKTGDFLPDLLETFFSGNNRAPRGHFILNQFQKNRSQASGVPGIPNNDVQERPNSVTFFSGRAWFGCQSTVYYSQILDSSSANKAGLCYQEADPTAEDISDLIASDGGVIPIPEADHIVALTPLGNGVMVFANNGVWFISGGDAAFSALNVAISKVSPIGTKSPGSIIETDGTIYWWSEIGIQALQQATGQFGPIAGRFGNTNIAESTIQTFYNEIPINSKHAVKAVYDPRKNTITWLYSSVDTTYHEYDSTLTYDLTLQAFYPWKFSNFADGPIITGLFNDVGYTEYGLPVPVQDQAINITSNGEVVTAVLQQFSARSSGIYYLTALKAVNGLTVSAPVSFDYVDWHEYDGVGLPYDSYILTGYELQNDAMRNKQIIYLFSHLRRTEADDGTNPSSCKLIVRWDWAGERNQQKWSAEVETYRPRSLNLTDVVVSKNKVRGSGKSIQFRFGTNEPGKTFDLLGWSVGFSGNTNP